MKKDTTNVLLGSGKLYIVALTEGAIPELDTIRTEENCIGDIKGGAELSYTPTIKEVKNDFNEVRKAFITSEEVSLKTGIMTWDLENMEKITVGAKYEKDSKELVIGGQSAIAQYAFVFIHEGDNSDIAVILKGYNGSGWTLKFDPENETTTDATIKATKSNDKTLVKIKEIARE